MSDLRAQLQTTLGTGYTLERERGGGMSRVFVARDEALGRDVVVEGYVDFHAWSDDGRSIYFVRANRTIEVIDVNANGEPVGPPRVVVPTSTLDGMSDVYRRVFFPLIPGTREMYVSLRGRRARSLMVLQHFAAFAARAK